MGHLDKTMLDEGTGSVVSCRDPTLRTPLGYRSFLEMNCGDEASHAKVAGIMV